MPTTTTTTTTATTAATPPDARGLRTRLKIGMEIHVELATRSKMWTGAPNVAHPEHYEARPNALLDPVVIGMPGTLPTMNREALDMSILVGLALGCTIAERCQWDRKSYYYPDLPKNYQISQYDRPIVGEGVAEFPLPDGTTSSVRILRAHLEEDAGKLLHEAPSEGVSEGGDGGGDEGGGGGMMIAGSIVDLNRAGTPLLEIVTHPDFESARACVAFAQWLRDLCRHLGVTGGVMQRGHMRFEPNINVIIEGSEGGGGGETFATPIVEIKNLNSFASLRGAIEYEYERQVEAWLDTGETMRAGSKSTRGWDDTRGVTFLQREKEEAHDYRYFPDPDLVEVAVDDAWLDRLRAGLPELPEAKVRRYVDALGLDAAAARQLVDEPGTARLYDAALDEGADARRTAALLLNAGAKHANERGVPLHDLGVTPAQIAGIDRLLTADEIGSSAADRLLGLLADTDDPAQTVARRESLLQVSDTAQLAGYVDQVLADPSNARALADLRGGKGKAIGSLMGQVMKLSKGQANPKLVQTMIRERVVGEGGEG